MSTINDVVGFDNNIIKAALYLNLRRRESMQNFVDFFDFYFIFGIFGVPLKFN